MSNERKLFLLPVLLPRLDDDVDKALSSKSNIEVTCSRLDEDGPNNGLKPKPLSSPASDPSIHKNEEILNTIERLKLSMLSVTVAMVVSGPIGVSKHAGVTTESLP